MTEQLIVALTGSGGAMIVLFLLLFWYMPKRDQRHTETMRRINDENRGLVKELVDSHERSLGRLSAALERNTRVLSLHSRGRLVRTLTELGMDPQAAMREAEQQIPLSAAAEVPLD